MEREGAEARVGITSYAAEALGDVVFAELPEQGRQVGISLNSALCSTFFDFLSKYKSFLSRAGKLGSFCSNAHTFYFCRSNPGRFGSFCFLIQVGSKLVASD